MVRGCPSMRRLDAMLVLVLFVVHEGRRRKAEVIGGHSPRMCLHKDSVTCFGISNVNRVQVVRPVSSERKAEPGEDILVR